MEDVADALRGEAQIRGLAPDEEVEGHVEELSPDFRVAGAAVVGDPDVGLLAEVGAPGGVVLE